MAMAAKEYVFSVRINRESRSSEVSHDGHISKEELKIALQDDTVANKIIDSFKKYGRDYKLKLRDYLTWYIPNYPTPVEFRTSEASHATHADALDGILDSEGFKADGDDLKFSWWSLKIDEECIKAAEERYLEEVFPTRSQEQRERQEAFLSKFTTSPAFHIHESRYGNFRFIFSINELMEAYKEQFCGGRDPVLREYKTMFYKQEIMYAVLVHSPDDDEKFQNYSRIEESKFVDYKDNQIVWRAQAIGDNIKFNLMLDEENRTANVEPVLGKKYYVWDHVCLAFHFNDVLMFDKDTLLQNCIPCKPAEIKTGKGKWCTYKEAEKILKDLKQS
ncbi:uncharacterized protein LOC130230938 [Danio aesculapii]|uniref:uncharacterized protein LOC130230938 n=1 Tax=Danio aesculapii TaxID=1142201 RepID=UPI0024C0193F|nr:uncharacterized protein LOC130230938 [Danio aesculapii]